MPPNGASAAPFPRGGPPIMLARMEYSDDPLSRSPELMSADDTGLRVIDVQEKLIRLLPDHERLVGSIGRLIDGAKLFKLPLVVTEQYPRGLGPTVPELAARLPLKVLPVTDAVATESMAISIL